MSLVYAGVCSHAPGITARADMADKDDKESFYAAFEQMRAELEATKPDAIVILAAEHFANFFMNNMPAYCIGMGEEYYGPIEDPDWLKIARTKVPGAPDLSKRIIEKVLQTVDVSYAQEWKFDHGISVPLHFLTPNYTTPVIPVNINCQGPPLTPLHRVWAFGKALREACDEVPERIAVIGTGGISHWPATPDSGHINVEWDKAFLEAWQANDKDTLLAYTDEQTYREGGQGGFEIRTFIAISALTEGLKGQIHYYRPIPIFAVGCTTGSVDLDQ